MDSRYLDTSGGPVAEWRLEEGIGTLAHDTSGQSNVGSLLPSPNGPAWVNGKWGKGLQFDGLDDYVDVGNPPSLDITGNQVTVEAWVKWNQPQTGYPGIVDKLYGGAYALKASGNTPYFYVVAGGQEGRTEYTGSPGGDLAWHHVVGTYDGASATMRLYVDASWSIPRRTLRGATSPPPRPHWLSAGEQSILSSSTGALTKHGCTTAP